MKIYKFGGASVKSSEGVRNLLSIAAGEEGPLFIVVSAMGKTTNALEGVLERVMDGDIAGAMDGFAAVEDYHRGIVEGLWGVGFRLPQAEALFEEVRGAIGREAGMAFAGGNEGIHRKAVSGSRATGAVGAPVSAQYVPVSVSGGEGVAVSVTNVPEGSSGGAGVSGCTLETFAVSPDGGGVRVSVPNASAAVSDGMGFSACASGVTVAAPDSGGPCLTGGCADGRDTAGAAVRALDAMSGYDRMYDGLVSYGELMSTVIISEYLRSRGMENLWVDMRRCLVTDGRHRDANVDFAESGRRLRDVVCSYDGRLFVGQGFIGATAYGEPTTLGREGSDYTAAVIGSVLGAESVAIWKDVDGILNADPRLFESTVHIPELSYLDAIELAYSGAQVIHPKTIKPLQNASIPLYVRPFMHPEAPGSVIRHGVPGPVNIPVYIVKGRQVLVSVRPKDFSFVLEERLSDVFAVFARYRQKISLIQSSAVNLSVCVDDSRQLDNVVGELRDEFRVVYNKGVELLTIRGYDADIYERYAGAEGVLLVQKTRRSVRIVRQEKK